MVLAIRILVKSLFPDYVFRWHCAK